MYCGSSIIMVLATKQAPLEKDLQQDSLVELLLLYLPGFVGHHPLQRFWLLDRKPNTKGSHETLEGVLERGAPFLTVGCSHGHFGFAKEVVMLARTGWSSMGRQ